MIALRKTEAVANFRLGLRLIANQPYGEWKGMSNQPIMVMAGQRLACQDSGHVNVRVKCMSVAVNACTTTSSSVSLARSGQERGAYHRARLIRLKGSGVVLG